MIKNESLHPLGKYIRLSKEKNTQLLATKHFGLSASEGLVELPFNKGKEDKSSYWILRDGQMTVNLMNVHSTYGLSYGKYSLKELGSISNMYLVFDVIDELLNIDYLALILKSQKTKNTLLHYACHGVEMVLPWEDFCSLPITVPPPRPAKRISKEISNSWKSN